MRIEPYVPTSLLAANLSVLPASKEKKYPAVGSWKTYQERLPSEHEVETWFANQHDALCLVCGKVSGNLEVIDFDHGGELFESWKAQVPPEILDRLLIEKTPSGGYHVAYRSEKEICGSLKLAEGIRETGKYQTLIETRGEGGLFLCAPSRDYTLIQGDYAQLPVLTAKERDTILQAAYDMDERPNHSKTPANVTPAAPGQNTTYTAFGNSSFEILPGEDYNAKADSRDLLIRHGWQSMGVQPDGSEYFRRPDKITGGHSASYKDKVLYVFSSNAYPFEAQKGYSPFHVYALLEHKGDFTEAAATLIEKGYGKEVKLPEVDLSEFFENLNKDLAKAEAAAETAEPVNPTTGVAVPAEPPKAEKHFFTASELMGEYKEMKEELIQGLLRREEVMNVVAAPKTGKSWLVMQLALALASGGYCFGRKCTKTRVLLVDNELHKETLSCRLRRVADAMGIGSNSTYLNDLVVFPQRGCGAAKDMLSLRNLLEPYDGEPFGVVILDALYKALPKDVDENSNGQITAIYNLLDGYAHAMKAAFILVHHTSKGNQANKSVTDLGSGAGAQSRAPDTHLTLRRHQDDGVVSVYSCVRSFPPVDPFCLRKSDTNIWVPAPECNPEALDGKDVAAEGRSKKRRLTVDAVVDAITNNIDTLQLPQSKTRLVELVRDKTDCSKAKAEAALDMLCELELLEVRNGDPAKHQQAMKCYYFGPESDLYVPPEQPQTEAEPETDGENESQEEESESVNDEEEDAPESEFDADLSLEE